MGGGMRARVLGGLLLAAFMLEAVVALDAGRRGGAFLSTTGSFTLSSGSNTAGNDESLLGEDLGEDATADDLDAAADHFLKLAGERKNKAKRKREAEQSAATSEVAELGDGALDTMLVSNRSYNVVFSKRRGVGTPEGYKLFAEGGHFMKRGSPGGGHPMCAKIMCKCDIKNFWAVFICNTKETKEGFHKGKMCGCSGRNVITKYDMGAEVDPNMNVPNQKVCQQQFWGLQTTSLTAAATQYLAAGQKMTTEGCTVQGPSSSASSGTSSGSKSSTKSKLSTISASGMKKMIKNGVAGKKKPSGPCKSYCRHKSMCTNHWKSSCKGCSMCG